MTDQPPPPPAQAPQPPPIAPPVPPPAAPPAGQWTPSAPAPGGAPRSPASKTRTYIVGAIVLALLVIGGYFISQNQNADELAIGQCFDEPSSSVDITTVVKHACTDAHDAEVFTVVQYDKGDTYPISTSVDSFIDERCVPAFETYIGRAYADDQDYTLGYFYPDETGWKNGKRTFTCYVTRADGTKLTQSVKGSAS